MKNRIKQMINQGKCVFGSWLMMNSQEVAEVLSSVGFDFLIIDGEHGSMDMETAGRMVSIIRRSNTVPILRIPWNDMVMAKQGLDTGAYGLLIPMVNSKKEAELAVSYCYYPPKGVRGFGAGRANMFFANASEYTPFANEEIMVIVQIESIIAVNAINEILSVPGIDVAFIGPFDLSYTMGHNGNINHPEVAAAIQKVLDSCNKHKIPAGIMSSLDRIQAHRKQGFRFIVAGIDGLLLHDMGKKYLKVFNENDA